MHGAWFWALGFRCSRLALETLSAKLLSSDSHAENLSASKVSWLPGLTSKNKLSICVRICRCGSALALTAAPIDPFKRNPILIIKAPTRFEVQGSSRLCLWGLTAHAFAVKIPATRPPQKIEDTVLRSNYWSSTSPGVL